MTNGWATVHSIRTPLVANRTASPPILGRLTARSYAIKSPRSLLQATSTRSSLGRATTPTHSRQAYRYGTARKSTGHATDLLSRQALNDRGVKRLVSTTREGSREPITGYQAPSIDTGCLSLMNIFSCHSPFTSSDDPLQRSLQ